MFSIKNNNLKSLSAGITTRAGSGKVGQYPVRKTGQPITGTKVKPSDPILKAVEAAKPQKALAHPKPFVVSKALAASKTLNVAPSPGTLKPAAACKPLNIVKRSSSPKATKASSLLKTPAASKVLDIAGAAGTPKLPPGLKAPGSPKTYAAAVAACKPLNIVKRSSAPKAPQVPSLLKTRPASKVIDTDSKISPSLQAADASKTSTPRASAVEAVRRQINEQKQKAAAVTARKAKAKSEPLPSAKPKAATPARDATPPPASVSRPKAELITATATAAENVLPRSPARRPLPAVRKGGVRKPLAAVPRPLSTAYPPSPAHTGGGCSRHQRNSLSAAARLSEHALTRRNAVRIRDPLFRPGASAHGPVVSRSSSAPLLGWAKAAATVTRSKSGPIAVDKVSKLTDADADTSPNVPRAVNQGVYSGDEGAADANAMAKAGEADTSTISTLVGSDEDAGVCVTAKVSDADNFASTLVGSDENASDHKLFATSPPFQIEIQDFDVQSDTFPAPRARDSMSSLATLSISSILDMFPAAPASIPGPLTQDVHRRLMEMSPASAADNKSADGNLSDTSSTSSISSILDQFPVVPTYIPRPLPQAAHRQLASVDPSSAADKVAADGGCADGGCVSSGSSTSSISSILDQFPVVPSYIPRPLPQTAHVQLASTSPAFVADKATRDIAPADGGMSSLSSILDQFPMVPTYIPHPLPEAAHAQLVGLRPASAADKPTSILGQLPMVPTYIPHPLPRAAHAQLVGMRPAPAADKPARDNAHAATPAANITPADTPAANITTADIPAPADKPSAIAPADDALVRISIISLDGDAPVLDTPAAWKAAFDGRASSVGPCEEKAPAAKAGRGVKGWWRRVVGRK